VELKNNLPGSQIMLAGPSDAGLADPGICTATSVLQTTTNLILYPNAKLTTLIVAECLSQLTDEIKETFATAEEQLAAEAKKIQRENIP
jgi:hypothetical protein